MHCKERLETSLGFWLHGPFKSMETGENSWGKRGLHSCSVIAEEAALPDAEQLSMAGGKALPWLSLMAEPPSCC